MELSVRIGVILKEDIRIIIAGELKNYVADICIFRIDISKFCHRYKFCSVIVLIIDKNPEIFLYYAVLLLSLIVFL